jgi:hypothetical protein
MKIRDCQKLLFTALVKTRIDIREDTSLGMSAAAVLLMARSYEKDGTVFFTSDDPVNALASYWYGFGWLHCGLALGLLANPDTPVCPFQGPHERLPSRFAVKLEEKTRRYAQLLDTARASVECAPDPATESCHFAEKVLFIAGMYAFQGRVFMSSGTMEDALACFSYGHGWLDATVTAGHFRIMVNRDLFTV